MKKYKKMLILLVIGIICLFSTKVKAANSISQIAMDVYIDKNGTAHITEKWYANLTEGTEGYKPYGNLGKCSITNFSVSDDTGKIYETLNYWSTSSSFNNKAYKCGIVKKTNGVELCWGISKYGSRIYTLNYNITNFVNQYTDNQGVYFSLIPKQFEQSPGSVKIKIYSDTKFNEKNSKIWAFGYKGGDINFSDGTIIMNSNGRLSSSSYMATLIKFENRIFNTTNKVNRTFNDIYNEAMSTVSNEEKDKKNMIMVILLPIIMYLAMFIIIIEIVKRYVSKKPSEILQFDGGTILPNQKEVNYFRDIPCSKDLFRAYWIIYEYRIITNSKAKSNLIGAILLKWIKEGKINISKTKQGLFSFKDNNYAIDLTNINSVDNELENRLLTYLKEASGKNLILEAKEFEKWCKKNYTILDWWFNKVIKSQTEELIKEGLIKEDTVIKKQLGVQITKKIRTVNASMREEAIKILGLKKFLLEYSMIQDRQAIEVHLWEEYLIYATLLGIADKVEEQFSKIYPEFKELSNLNTKEIISCANQFAYLGVTSAAKARERVERNYSSGSGGSSYSGGGSSASGSSSGGGFR